MRDPSRIPRLPGLRVPSPLVGWILTCTGIAFGGLMLSISRTLESQLMFWLGTAATYGGPIAGIALFVYYLMRRRAG